MSAGRDWGRSLYQIQVTVGRRKNRCNRYERCLLVETEGDHCIKYKWPLDGVKIAVSNTSDVGESRMSVVTVAESFLLFTVTCQIKVVWSRQLSSSISSSNLNSLLVFDTATSQDKTPLVFDTASISRYCFTTLPLSNIDPWLHAHVVTSLSKNSMDFPCAEISVVLLYLGLT